MEKEKQKQTPHDTFVADGNKLLKKLWCLIKNITGIEKAPKKSTC